jgi:hypothetical protein
MLVKIFTQGDGPEMREALDFGKRLEEEDYIVEYYDESDEKVSPQLELYDIYSYPTFVVAREDGQVIECWRVQIPLASDIKMFLNA